MDVSKVISRATDLGTGMTVFFIRTYLRFIREMRRWSRAGRKS